MPEPKIPAEFMPLRVKVASWNTAAVNNNPFEYWISSSNPSYDVLMKKFQTFIENRDNDFCINQILTQKMFDELCKEMLMARIEGVESLKILWTDEFSPRMAIHQFLMDDTIGTKRLASMPDRITNTIHLADGSILTRPTAINSYDKGSLNSLNSWWSQWTVYMFHTDVILINSGDSSIQQSPQRIYSLIGPLLRSKYPAISIDEQAISVALQILCLAILDAILVYILNLIMPVQWESIRRELCNALIASKNSRTCSILVEAYSDHDIIFIQEAAAFFANEARLLPDLRSKFTLVCPWNMDAKRNQNSLILVNKQRFKEESAQDVTQQVCTFFALRFTPFQIYFSLELLKTPLQFTLLRDECV